MAIKKTKGEIIAGLQEHVLSLERRLMSNRDGEDDDDGDDVPIFSNTSPTQLVFRIEDVTRQRDQYKGAIEVVLIENNKLSEKRDHSRNLYMGLLSSSSTNNTNNAGITQNFNSGSQSQHYHIGTAQISMAPDGNPYSGFGVQAPNPNGSDTKRPTYSDGCRRKKENKSCRTKTCPYWHRYQGARWAAIRPTLFADKSAENRTKHC